MKKEEMKSIHVLNSGLHDRGSFLYGNNTHRDFFLFSLLSSTFSYKRLCLDLHCACQKEINIGNFLSLLPRNTSANLTLAEAGQDEGATASENK